MTEAAGLVSLLTFLPSVAVLSSCFFTGDPVGEATGEATGLAVVTGVGEATVGFGGSGFGSQAPSMAALAANTVDNINDLLIVFLLFMETCGRSRSADTDIHSRSEMTRLSAIGIGPSGPPDRRITSTLRESERASPENLQKMV